MQFTIDHNCPHSDARTGVIKTAHGDIQTPVFMPVGTAGAIKAVTMEQMEQETDARIILGNTYHLYLRPGIEILKEVGGLHRFGTWSKPILTDSGGYQVFSLAAMRRITPEGVTFASHIDGSRHLFTPERVMEIERAIGADIMMAFDECCPGDASYAYAKQSLDTTEQWLDRCIKHLEHTPPLYGYEQALFPIVQGCVYPDLRRRAAEHIASLGAPGNAIGGLAVGEPTDKMYEMIELTNSILPKDKPRYLMGVGTPANILEGIARGVDMFDCIMPVSYTHLDVYKRQLYNTARPHRAINKKTPMQMLIPDYPNPLTIQPSKNPVSYTHLDVYKRQVMCCAFLTCSIIKVVTSRPVASPPAWRMRRW